MSVKVCGRVRVCLGTDGSRILLAERKGILEATREMVWPSPQLMKKLRHKGAAGLPFVSLLAAGRSGAKLFCACPVTPQMSHTVVVCITTQLPPWSKAGFLGPSNSLALTHPSDSAYVMK